MTGTVYFNMISQNFYWGVYLIMTNLHWQVITCAWSRQHVQIVSSSCQLLLSWLGVSRSSCEPRTPVADSCRGACRLPSTGAVERDLLAWHFAIGAPVNIGQRSSRPRCSALRSAVEGDLPNQWLNNKARFSSWLFHGQTRAPEKWSAAGGLLWNEWRDLYRSRNVLCPNGLRLGRLARGTLLCEGVLNAVFYFLESPVPWT